MPKGVVPALILMIAGFALALAIALHFENRRKKGKR